MAKLQLRLRKKGRRPAPKAINLVNKPRKINKVAALKVLVHGKAVSPNRTPKVPADRVALPGVPRKTILPLRMKKRAPKQHPQTR
jgi:hypothetical protein